MVQLSLEFEKFLEDNSFKFIEPPFEGAGDIYSSDDLTLRFVQDRNLHKSVEIKCHEHPDEWYDLIELLPMFYKMMNI